MESTADSQDERIETLSKTVLEAVEDLLESPDEHAEEDFRHLLSRVNDLVRRKLETRATKGETRDLLAEVLFSRLLRGFQKFVAFDDPHKAAELIMGTLMTGAVLDEFAQVIDQVMTEATSPHDYHLAGRADFISINELLQLLNAGKHTGRLILEKPENQLDIYIKEGAISFVDPYRVHQRLVHGKSMNTWREIPANLLAEANQRRAAEGFPILLTLLEKRFLKKGEFKSQLRNIGSEFIFNFLQDEKECSFSYKAMKEFPESIAPYNAALPVMPLLLEGHKRIDDWRRICRVFPDLKEPIQPAPDLFARIAEMSLGVVEIKVLTLVNGENSFAQIQETVGLNSFNLGMMLVGFGRQGILVPPGGPESLFEEDLSTEESMQAAADALSANEGFDGIPETMDSVTGSEEEEFGLGFLRAARKDENED